MYLTSQRVSAPGEERTGINTYLYRHEEAVARIDWDRPDLARIVDEFPGTLVAHAAELPPGGNLVRSYLDIVTSEATSVDEVDSALRQFAREWPASRIGQVVHVGSERATLKRRSMTWAVRPRSGQRKWYSVPSGWLTRRSKNSPMSSPVTRRTSSPSMCSCFMEASPVTDGTCFRPVGRIQPREVRMTSTPLVPCQTEVFPVLEGASLGLEVADAC
jgi:hypothetical protein